VSHKSTSNEYVNLLILTNGGWESLLIYMKTCSCMGGIGNIEGSNVNSRSAGGGRRLRQRFITLNKLIAPNYQRSAPHEMMRMVRAKKERLVKTSFYNDEMKLKEYYVTMCRNLNCFGCMLFTVHEIVFDLSEAAIATGKISFRKVKRLLAIKPNKILLVDYKTKALAKSQRMCDLKSWYSGDGYCNLTPMFLLNSSANSQNVEINNPSLGSNSTSMPHLNGGQQGAGGGGGGSSCHQATGNLFMHLFRMATSSAHNSIDMNKLFVIEFNNNVKWHMQIDDFHSLKSITCILLDQSLDMGIDNNPLMLDLTISEHFQNRFVHTKYTKQTIQRSFKRSFIPAFCPKRLLFLNIFVRTTSSPLFMFYF
jgi:hypothetical protein